MLKFYNLGSGDRTVWELKEDHNQILIPYSDIAFEAELLYGLYLKTIGHSFLTRGDVSRLLISFANSLDLDQDRQNVGPDLDQNRLTLR